MEPSHRRASCAPRLLELPTEVQLVCLGFAADAATLASCLASCSALRSLQESAFEVFCHRNWPEIASVAANALEGALPPDAYWQTVAHTAKLLASASIATTPPARSFNQHVTAARREILIEWLIEVSEDWNLGGAEVFKAVRIMDAFLAAKPLTSLGILQLVGICCLRVAMQMGSGPGGCASQQRRQQAVDPHPDPPSSGVRGGQETDAKVVGTGAGATAVAPVDPYSASASAFVCAGIYSVKSIEEMTEAVGEFVRLQQEERSVPLIRAPTARHFLRVLWIAAVEALPPAVAAPAAFTAADVDRVSTAAAAVPSSGEAAAAAVVPPPSRGAVLHLSGFLLHLSLLDPACCAAPPSHAAAAAVSLALEVLGLPRWPPALRRALPLREVEDVAPLRQRIAEVQAQHDVSHLREVWMWELAMRHWRMEPVQMPGGRRWMGVDGADGAAPRLGTPGAAALGGASPTAEGAGASGGGGDGSGACASGSTSGNDGSGAGSSSGGGGGVPGDSDVGDAVKAMRLRVETVIRCKGPLPLG